MTLHVALLTGSHVLQVGDRLLTQGPPGSATAWDPYANKTLLVLADNGTLAVSYSGLAHVTSMPTDQWLAEAILGQPFNPGVGGGLSSSFGTGTAHRVTVGSTFAAVRRALESDLPGQPVSDPRERNVSVMMCGWTWKRRARWGYALPRPFARILRHYGGVGPVKVEQLPRAWRWDQLIQVVRTGVNSDAWKAKLLDDLSGNSITSVEAEALLVAWIRTVASDPQGDVVGPNCLAVCIGRDQQVTINFHRETASSVLRTAYSPFIVGRGLAVAPMAITGGTPFLGGTNSGGLEWRIPIGSIPPLPEAGTREMYGLPRRPWP